MNRILMGVIASGPPVSVVPAGLEGLINAAAPVGFWKLDDYMSSGTGVDQTGNLDGTWQPTLSTAAGIIPEETEDCTDFDTGGGYLDLLDSVSGGHPFTNFGASGDSWSIIFWFTRGAGSIGGGAYWQMPRTLFELRQQGSSGIHVPFAVGIESDKLSVGMTSNYITDFDVVSSAASIDGAEPDRVYMGAIVNSSNSNIKIYIDGVEDVSTAIPNVDRSVGSATCNMQIGLRSRDGGQKDTDDWDGKGQFCAIFDRVLTPGEISDFYSAATGA